MAKGKTVAALLLAWTLSAAAYAQTVALATDHPDRYTVVKGDTLWDISARFLRDPWLWPEIWHVNPDIENPHLIYPGDVIVLSFKDGKPVLSLERRPLAESELPVVKLSPQVRTTELDSAIATIPMDAIQQFLTRTRVVGKADAEKSPYIVSMEEGRLIGGSEHEIYARKMPADSKGKDYSVFRIGETYQNPGARKEDILGYEAIHVADARVLADGDPSTLLITQSSREALPGDRLLLEKESRFDRNFMPYAPKEPIEGQIISVPDAVSRVGRYQVVVVNLGLRDGAEPGLVLAVNQAGETVRDLVREDKSEAVKLPDTRAGLVMLFRTFERVSYGLVMQASRDIRLYDTVTNP